MFEFYDFVVECGTSENVPKPLLACLHRSLSQEIVFSHMPVDSYELVWQFVGLISVKKVAKSAKICFDKVYKNDSVFLILLKKKRLIDHRNHWNCIQTLSTLPFTVSIVPWPFQPKQNAFKVKK